MKELIGTNRIRFRTIQPVDTEPTRQIYNYAVTSTTATLDLEPRTVAEQERWVRDHMGIYTALVAELDGQVVGFASISPFRPRPGYSSSVEDSIYLDPSVWGQGLGKLLLNRLLVAAADLGFHTCIAHVVADHEASLGLHQSQGFQLVGIEREIGRKFGRWIDLAILQLML
jgi:phosphinothricin acetyltransferase